MQFHSLDSVGIVVPGMYQVLIGTPHFPSSAKPYKALVCPLRMSK